MAHKCNQRGDEMNEAVINKEHFNDLHQKEL